MTGLAEPVRLGRRIARNRLVFGPHETNLGRGRSLSDRHVAYYAARAAGGAGVVVVEEASVDDSDWPYERAPLASACDEGWSAVSAACREHGTLVVAALGHAGGQGSSAWHQRALLAPSRTADVETREVAKALEADECDGIVAAFAAAAARAVAAGVDGVELNGGQYSLLRQFCSGLTNQRGDALGTDRSEFGRRVVAAVRAAVDAAGAEAVVGLRLSCDELAPWAGIVPEAAAGLAASLAGAGLDYLTVVRGSAYGTWATRPDGHVEPGFNDEAAALVRRALPAGVALVAQGSIVEPARAEGLVASGAADLVEMTRAFIADPELGNKVAAGQAERVRPCLLCNQTCRVRDVRNPLVTCVTEPRSGHETTDAPVAAEPGAGVAAATSGRLLVVGGGPAGLECARVAASAGRAVTLVEREEQLGGALRIVAELPGHERFALLADWLEDECRRAGVELVTGSEVTLERLDSHDGPVVCCTGSRPGRRSYEVVAGAAVATAAEVLEAERTVAEAPPSPAVVWDPVGGPVGVGVAELLAAHGAAVTLVTPDHVAGEQLSRTGDLAPGNVRLAQRDIAVAKRSVVTQVTRDAVTVRERYSGEETSLEAALLVDAGPRLPDDVLWRAAGGRAERAGDAVAPRTVHEAILEGRRVAQRLVGDVAAGGALAGAAR